MVWQTVGRITKEILGVKGSREWECLPKNKIIHVPKYVVNAFVAFSNKQAMVKKNSGLTWKKKPNNFEIMDLKYWLPPLSAIKKILTSFSGLNNFQILVFKNVEEEKLLSENITFHLLIKTITKFFNMIGYHQPNLSTYSTVYVSYL